MPDELKPCPYCGHKTPVVRNEEEGSCWEGNGCWIVACINCDAEGPPGWIGVSMISTRKQAVINWNTRKCECHE